MIETMSESLVKFLLLFVGAVAVACGLVFLVAADWFVTVSGAEAANVGWLRMLGGAVAVIHGFGLFIVAFRRRDTNLLLFIISFATSVMIVSLWFSLFTKEFSAERSWTTILPAIVGTAVAAALWVVWLARRKSVGDLPDRAKRREKKADGEESGGADEMAADEPVDDAATDGEPHTEADASKSESGDADSGGDET